MHVTLLVQCFPPLIHTAGGVSKRYYRLCKCFIEEYGYRVTIVTPIDIASGAPSPDIAGWLRSGALTHVPVSGFLLDARPDGLMLGCNLLSPAAICTVASVLRATNVVFMDDIFQRQWFTLLVTAMGVPCVVTSHTDFSKTQYFKSSPMQTWMFEHLHSAFTRNVVHATTTAVYAGQRGIRHVWPPMLWSEHFTRDWPALSVRKVRLRWLSGSSGAHGVCLYAGRISSEKRVDLLIRCIPDTLALVIVGDCGSDETYMSRIASLSAPKPNVRIERGFVASDTLALYYQSCDLYVSASSFETCGNSVVEALACGAAVAVQPAQGHLEWVRDTRNGFFIDYDDAEGARRGLERAFHSRLHLPELPSTRAWLRGCNFGQAVHDKLVAPAVLNTPSACTRLCSGALYLALWVAITPLYLVAYALFESGLTRVKNVSMYRHGVHGRHCRNNK